MAVWVFGPDWHRPISVRGKHLRRSITSLAALNEAVNRVMARKSALISEVQTWAATGPWTILAKS